MILSWQHEQWQQLHQSRQANRLPHALLLKGSKGVGKKEFADYFARALLCGNHTSDGYPCDTCHSCRLMLGKSHPDYLCVQPEKEGQSIKVDQIREVTDYVSQSSLQCGYRVVVIHPANAMNISAANALLKTLEEPSSGAIIILITNQGSRLPATILSRCQSLYFPNPPAALAREWIHQQAFDTPISADLLLSLANGGPLNVKSLLESGMLPARESLFQHLSVTRRQDIHPIKLADSLSGFDLGYGIDFYLGWIADILRIQITGQPDNINNTDFKASLMLLAASHDASQTSVLMEYAQKIRKRIGEGMNLNKQLVWEDLLIRWVNYVNFSR